MKRTSAALLLFVFLFAVGCDGNRADNTQQMAARAPEPPQVATTAPPAGPAVAAGGEIKPSAPASEKLVVTAKPPFEAQKVLLHHDTLFVVSPSDSVFYPFGEKPHAAQLAARAPRFAVEMGSEVNDGQVDKFTILRYKRSAVKFYDEEEFGATVVAGRIVDPEVKLPYGLGVGQSLSQVLNALFKQFPVEKAQRIKVVRIKSALDAIIYYYNFDQGVLSSITMDSPALMDKSLDKKE